MDKKHAPYLFFMGVGEYAVIKDKWRNIDVDYYVEKNTNLMQNKFLKYSRNDRVLF